MALDSLQPPIHCWFCDLELAKGDLLRDGIIRSRKESLGGPFRLYLCPGCGRENLCEKTSRGRWFASPNFRLTFFEYIFTQILDRGAENLLAAISWFRNNEDRRRRFFERDGDAIYSGKSFLLRLWPGARLDEGATGHEQKRARERAEKARRERERREREWRQSREERAEESRRRATGAGRGERAARERPHGIVSPYEILGVEADAGEREIHAAFHRLAIHYHPDKVHHLGEEFRLIAHAKFTQLKRAYETLLERHARREQS